MPNEEKYPRLIIPTDRDEACPVCGSEDLALWAEDGESPRADFYSCEACKASGDVVQPLGWTDRANVRVAWEMGPTLDAVQVLDARWQGWWCVPVMTRPQVVAMMQAMEEMIADVPGVNAEDFEAFAWAENGTSLLVTHPDSDTDTPTLIHRGEADGRFPGLYVIDLGWTFDTVDPDRFLNLHLNGVCQHVQNVEEDDPQGVCTEAEREALDAAYALAREYPNDVVTLVIDLNYDSQDA